MTYSQIGCGEGNLEVILDVYQVRSRLRSRNKARVIWQGEKITNNHEYMAVSTSSRLSPLALAGASKLSCSLPANIYSEIPVVCTLSITKCMFYTMVYGKAVYHLYIYPLICLRVDA